MEIKYYKSLKNALNFISKCASKSIRNEICGFIGFCPEKKSYAVQIEKNSANEPDKYFEINPIRFLLFKDNYNMVSIFHSHIVGSEEPSDFDIKSSINSNCPFLIYSLNTKKFKIFTPELCESNVITNTVKELYD